MLILFTFLWNLYTTIYVYIADLRKKKREPEAKIVLGSKV